MTRQLVAYSAYAAGSVVFLAVALRRGSELVALGSVLFLLGTLLLLVPMIRGSSVRRGGGAPASRRSGLRSGSSGRR